MATKRIKWLDFAKGITILSVVLIHLLPRFSIFEYVLDTFAMPVFFAISGYLYKRTNTLKRYLWMIYKKFVGILIPYIIFTIYMVVLSVLQYKKGHFISIIFYHIAFPIGFLWFLYALFWIFLLVGLMDLFHIKLYCQLFVPILLLILCMMLHIHLIYRGNFNPLLCIIEYMICFYVGILVKNYNEVLKLSFTPIILFVSWIILLIIQIHITGLNNYGTDFFNIYDIFTKLLSIPVIFSLFMHFPQNNFTFKYFTKYGKYTLIIYIADCILYPTIQFLNKPIGLMYLQIINGNGILLRIILLIITWEILILISLASTRVKLIKFIFYPRKYTDNLVLHSDFGKWILK